VTLEISGAQIKIVLEEALENAFKSGGSTGAYPYAAGLRYAVNANEVQGNRISELEINIRLAEASWTAIETETLYTVVTNDFLAGGRDGYFEFGRVDESLVVNTFTEYSQTFIDFAIQEGTLVSPSLDEFSTQSFVPLGAVSETTDAPTGAPTGAPTSSAGKSLISLFGITTTLVTVLVF
jgi:5'-nucleotidase/UDP-sugar diphosphatase